MKKGKLLLSISSIIPYLHDDMLRFEKHIFRCLYVSIIVCDTNLNVLFELFGNVRSLPQYETSRAINKP